MTQSASIPGRSPAVIPFDNSYARLPERFYQRIGPIPVHAPRLVCFNRALAEELGLDAAALEGADGAEIFSGNAVPPRADPVAMAYAGHQFGHFVPQLGDGRAVLLGEVIGRDGRRRDIHLKGSGRTAFSRQGDGRAALGPMLREYIISEAMHALGIPTTRSLAVATTGETVLRDEGPLPGAVLTRVALSHVRVGTFEYFAARDDREALKILADYVIDRCYPALKASAAPYRDLLAAVRDAQAALVAQWMHVGFIHGVMNTDNTSITGETIDYGPCAFMDAYDPAAVFSSIDRHGRYAFGNQAAVMHWNLAVLAQCLLPLLDPDADKAVAIARETLAPFMENFSARWLSGMRRKLGLARAEDGDAALIGDLLELMQAHQADYTLTFRHLCKAEDAAGAGPLIALFPGGGLETWLPAWRARLQKEAADPAARAAAMRAASPEIIPRNHRVQQALDAATEHDDFTPFRQLMDALADPYAICPERAPYMQPPAPEERVCRTFCGT
jgi:uncharacterized protein YdiU (UPF0061 family)